MDPTDPDPLNKPGKKGKGRFIKPPLSFSAFLPSPTLNELNKFITLLSFNKRKRAWFLEKVSGWKDGDISARLEA
jgi:hypothetical protein